MKSRVRVSLIIPAYNEEDYIGRCLAAIAAQTIQPFEVIVVDNNSSDHTAAIAETFPFVTLVCESRQGVAFARQRGFDMARGDVIGRIDADTLIAPDWVARVQDIFANQDIAAASGAAGYYDIALKTLVGRADAAIRAWTAKKLGNAYFWGANMAVRRNVWQSVKGELCTGRRLHEDIDLGAHMFLAGCQVQYDPGLRTAVSGRLIDRPPQDFWHYLMNNPYVYHTHKIAVTRYTILPITIVVVCYPLLWMLYAGYNEQKKAFSFLQLFSRKRYARPNPATFGDF